VTDVSTSPADLLTPPARDNRAALLDVRAVAALLDCSPRHVYRLSDAGRMPPPVKLGSLVRWPRQAIEDWITTGCKPCRTAGRA
jgi:excisionase family DNA binding protein